MTALGIFLRPPLDPNLIAVSTDASVIGWTSILIREVSDNSLQIALLVEVDGPNANPISTNYVGALRLTTWRETLWSPKHE